MAREHLEKREKWQDDSAERGQEAEVLFGDVLREHFEETAFRIEDKPKDLANIYGAITTRGRRSGHGVRPDHSIRNLETRKIVYVEIKRQRAAGNAHERACKFMMPGIVGSAREIAAQPEGVIPFWWVFTNGIASDERYRREIMHWFCGIEGHVLLWRNTRDGREVTGHFERHIRPLLV